MKKRALLLLGVASMAAVPAIVFAQRSEYPITVIAPGKGPYAFPEGYQTPWDRIEIIVTEKMSPNLFVLHGSQGLDPAHPDASGGRAMALFGPDGVLMVDTENRQVADKTLKAIRSFTSAPIKALVNTHIHPDHTGANAFFAQQGALIFSQNNLRNEMLHPPLRANGQPGPAPDMAGIPVVIYDYNPAAPGQPAVTFNMNGETVDLIPMMPSHTAGDTIVRFRKANVIYIEDFYRNFGYPFADQANGGSVRGMLDAVDLIERLAGSDTRLVPGHGALVTKNGVNYILSNNHILADTDTATVGDPISQPGLIDANCDANQTQTVANFSQAVKLGTGNVDAALAQVVNGEVDLSGAILDVGVPANTVAPIGNTSLGRGVAKSGRTTGLTCATINSINTNVKIQYQKSCNAGKKFTVTYTNQVLINGSTFSAGGDSGSLIVTSDTAQPIALLYAGSSTTTIGNRISDVTSALGVSFVGGGTHSVSCPAAAPAPTKPHGKPSQNGFVSATKAKDKHVARLMSDPAVLAVGLGASEADPSEAVVTVHVEKGRGHGAIPAQLDGVPTRIIETDAFRAYGWNESEPKACSAK